MPVECEYCHKQFQDDDNLITHQTTCIKIMRNNIEQGMTSKENKYTCFECGKKFPKKSLMLKHQWVHRKNRYPCEVCDSQFEKESELNKYRLSVHSDRPNICTECGKSFAYRKNLNRHRKLHTDKFPCDKCPKMFSSHEGYLRHSRTHTGERLYNCEFCSKSFVDSSKLKQHERIHTDERPYVCPLYLQKFTRKDILRYHVPNVHTSGKDVTEANDPPFKCSICGGLNEDGDELCAHIMKHSDQLRTEAKQINNSINMKTKL